VFNSFRWNKPHRWDTKNCYWRKLTAFH